MLKTFTCIICPNGCEIEAELDDTGKKLLSLSGNLCPRGEGYVKQELTAPKRTIATSVLLENGALPLASVRLTEPIPKERIFDVMAQIRTLRLTAPVRVGQVVSANILGLGSDLIVTKNIPTGAGNEFGS